MALKILATFWLSLSFFSHAVYASTPIVDEGCTLERFGLEEGGVFRYMEQLRVMPLAGQKTMSIPSRVSRTLEMENGGEYDKLYKSFQVRAVTDKTDETKLFPFQRLLVTLGRQCVDAVGYEERAFGGSNFTVITTGEEQYLVRVAWSE